MKKQMHAQQSRSCGMQEFKNKYCIYSCCACSRYQIYLWAAPVWRSRCMRSKVEAVACRTLKINIVFTDTVVVHVTKYIYWQHLYEAADACTAKWSCGMQDLKNNYYVYSWCGCSRYQTYLWAALVWRTRCMHSKVESVASRTLKIIIMFTAAVLIHVTKYIYKQHLYEEADACTAK